MTGRPTRARVTVAGALLAVLAVTLGACTSTIEGTATRAHFDINNVAGLPVYNGDNGLRPGVAPADTPVEGTTGSDVDTLATDAVTDVQDYWKQEYPTLFDGQQLEPVDTINSYDARDRSGPDICGESTYKLVNAFYCDKENSISWDRGVLLPYVADTFSPMADVFVLAHEYGHAIQFHAKLNDDNTPSIVLEQQADCFGGAYMRHVAEGKSNFFTLDTAQGLNDVIAGAISTRDPVGTDPNDTQAHGSAFDRVTAFSYGFTDGPAKCLTITTDEVNSRVSALPSELSSASDTGDIAVDEQSVGLITDSLNAVFPEQQPVQVDLGGADVGCSDAPATPPVSYCPASHTLGVDLPQLRDIGTPVAENSQDPLPSVVRGDFSAFVLVASRYALSVQQAQGLPLDQPLTGLRSACLAGSWATKTTQSSNLQLSPGDVDEAVASLLSDGIGASDVKGTAVLSGFARVEAFRTGALDGEDACASVYA